MASPSADPSPLEPSPPSGAASKARVALWDHARFTLIVLVVFTHLLTTIRSDNQIAYALYVFMFLFHMPGFIMLAGVFAKAEVNDKLIRSVWQLVTVWIIWEGLWAVINIAFSDEWPGDNWLIHPAWTLWFLVTLATMRILLPFIVKLRYPLTFSVALALIAGALSAVGVAFSASRTLYFLPFFVLGWTAKQRGWFEHEWFLRPSRSLRVAAGALLGGAGALLLLIPNLRDIWTVDFWLLGNAGYAQTTEDAPPFGVSLGEWDTVVGMGVRLAVLVSGVLLTLAVLLVVSRRESRFTVWGARTLFIYLLHGPIVQVLRKTGVIDAVDGLGWIGVPVLFLLALCISALLATWIVSVVFRPIIEPNVDWMLRRRNTSGSA